MNRVFSMCVSFCMSLAFLVAATEAHSATSETVVESESIISKGIDSEAIRDTVFLESVEVSACYGEALKKAPGMTGMLRLSWDIDENGKARNFKKDSGTFNNDGVVKCIAGVLEKAEFPRARAGETVRVEYPFVLSL